ncbi:MAG: hypothetical protein R2784_09945 [Saprospiraceae bacterium]
MNKSLLLVAPLFFLVIFTIRAQHINLNNHSPVTHMLDRWSIKYGVNEDMPH